MGTIILGKQLIASLGSALAAQAMRSVSKWDLSDAPLGWGRSRRRSGGALQSIVLAGVGVAVGAGVAWLLSSEGGKEIRQRTANKFNELKQPLLSSFGAKELNEAQPLKQSATKAGPKPRAVKPRAGARPKKRTQS
jgi:hypothetical protein